VTRICVFGAGAVGGLLAARLTQTGASVSLVARGAHLAAIRESGLRLIGKDSEISAYPEASDDPAALGPQDYVVLTVKASGLTEAAPSIAPLIGPETVIVPAQNGLPWWYFHRLPGAFADRRLQSVDPGGMLWRALPPSRVIGCVVYVAAEIVEPGRVRHLSGQSFLLGDPGNGLGERVAEFAQLLSIAGFTAPIVDDIRQELWLKLWGNLSFNPLSIITGAPLDQLAREADTRMVARRMMEEAQCVAEALGVHFPMDIDRRIAAAEAVGPHKTSMLQDFERGRPLEIDAMLGAVIEIGRLVGIAMPICEMIYGLVCQRARLAGCALPPQR
jgi:2-dehydropantoate 2-reductase